MSESECANYKKLTEVLATTTARAERLERQAVDMSIWLSEAGIGPCPIPEGVKILLQRAEALQQENDTLRTTTQERASDRQSPASEPAGSPAEPSPGAVTAVERKLKFEDLSPVEQLDETERMATTPLKRPRRHD